MMTLLGLILAAGWTDLWRLCVQYEDTPGAGQRPAADQRSAPLNHLRTAA